MRDLSSIARVEGPILTLRLIEPEDAAYVHSLRSNTTTHAGDLCFHGPVSR